MCLPLTGGERGQRVTAEKAEGAEQWLRSIIRDELDLFGERTVNRLEEAVRFCYEVRGTST